MPNFKPTWLSHHKAEVVNLAQRQGGQPDKRGRQNNLVNRDRPVLLMKKPKDTHNEPSLQEFHSTENLAAKCGETWAASI